MGIWKTLGLVYTVHEIVKQESIHMSCNWFFFSSDFKVKTHEEFRIDDIENSAAFSIVYSLWQKFEHRWRHALRRPRKRGGPN